MPMWLKKTLVRIGFLSPCCHAGTFSPHGWDRKYCNKCYKRIY